MLVEHLTVVHIVIVVLFALSKIKLIVKKVFAVKIMLGAVLLTLSFLGAPSSVLARENSIDAILRVGIKFVDSLFSITLEGGDEKDAGRNNDTILAQGQSMQGGKNQLTIFYKTINDIATHGGYATTTPSCPSGWSTFVDGYGPHYIGMFAYDWNGSNGGGGFSGWYPPFPGDPGGSYSPGREPEDPPPPPEPGGGGIPPDEGPPPTTGGPGGGPTTPGGGYYPGEDVPPPYPGPVGPDGEPLGGEEGGPGPQFGPEGPRPWLPGDLPSGERPETPTRAGGTQGSSLHKSNIASLLDVFLKKATAQQPYVYELSSLDLEGSSICSTSQRVVVDTRQMYQNGYTTSPQSLFADACYSTNCNRCLICTK